MYKDSAGFTYRLGRLNPRASKFKGTSDQGVSYFSWKSSNYIDLIRDIKEHIASLLRKGIETTVAWAPGHADIAGNEQPDTLAKEAAQEATTLSTSFNIIIINDVKQAAQKIPN